MSITPGDPTLWSSVLFVRSGVYCPFCIYQLDLTLNCPGPYASAVLRFQIRFPTSYPDLPPLVTFSTDVFHPLIVPLTTYTFSTGASTEDPVSATDEERLPPGGFSLRHGFPHWFGRAKKSEIASTASSRAESVRSQRVAGGDIAGGDNPETGSIQAKTLGEDIALEQQQYPGLPPPRKTVPVAELLDYIRSTFDNETVLDSLALEAAGNPGAWHAWKAHRGDSNGPAGANDPKRATPQARLPGDWHWDGVWARRVQSEVEASHSEPMLYGSSARAVGDEMIRFSHMDDATLSSVIEKIVPQVEGVQQ